MRLTNIFTLLTAWAVISLAAPSTSSLEKRFTTFSNVNVFSPPSNYRVPKVLYARTVLLSNGYLLATWENYSPEPPQVYWPIYQSTNGGLSWTQISEVTDTHYGWGNRYQPFLYVMPQAIGSYPAGTILIAGNSIPSDLSKTLIVIYASKDGGHTWSYVSSVAAGGAANTNDGQTPVWEPFLLTYNNHIVCYYSDQRDPSYAQKLVYQTSSNLKSWSGVTNVVAVSPYTARPGMATVAAIPGGKYILTYEYGGGPGVSGYGFPVYYRISSSPLTFASATAYELAVGSDKPQSSPYVVWTSAGGADGTIVVSSGTHSELFGNTALGDPNKWYTISTPQPSAYSRHLRILDSTHLLVMGAGYLPPSSTNTVSVSVQII